jgi:hypothetical protein
MGVYTHHFLQLLILKNFKSNVLQLLILKNSLSLMFCNCRF